MRVNGPGPLTVTALASADRAGIVWSIRLAKIDEPLAEYRLTEPLLGDTVSEPRVERC